MEICPFCHTEVGCATVCKSCGAYKDHKTVPAIVDAAIFIVSAIIAMFIGSSAREFGVGVFSFFFIWIPFFLIVKSHYKKNIVWKRKF